jgi:hypothetical protein
MEWWLSVLFLVNGVWILGDDIRTPGWGPRAYATEQECLERRTFAERQSREYPLEYPTEWRCTSPSPLRETPDDLKGVQVAADVRVGSNSAVGSSATGPLAECETALDSSSIKYDLLTSNENRSIPEKTVVLKYSGPILGVTVSILTEAWSDGDLDFETFIIDLDSQGGDLDSVEQVVKILGEIGTNLRLVTLVRQGSHCLSGCVPVFMAGVERIGGNASVWMLHGACWARTNVPSLELTQRYLSLMKDAGAGSAFIDELVAEGYLLRPGQYWLSGHELFERDDANVITRLIGPWMPETARGDFLIVE